MRAPPWSRWRKPRSSGCSPRNALPPETAEQAPSRRSAMSSPFTTPLWILRVAALLSAGSLLAATPAHAEVKSWPATFRAEQMPVSDGTQYVRVGGTGPAVVLLHGFGDTGDMWVPLAEVLMKDHTVIVPDLRGMGLSSHPEDGYRKVAQGRDLAGILDRLGIKDVTLVTHDIRNMGGYAFPPHNPTPPTTRTLI